jgi:hypothetical protein
MNQQPFTGEMQSVLNALDLSVAGLGKLQPARFASHLDRGNRAAVQWPRLVAALTCLILLVSVSKAAFAQVDISALLAGNVSDQTGAVVPKATVTAQNEQTGVKNQTVSDTTGYYSFVSLPAGSYTISCAVNGFKTFVATGVVLHNQGAVTLPVTLQVGVAAQTVRVSGSSAMIDTETANAENTIQADLIQSIPVQGRDPRQSLELLTPGATAAGQAASFFITVTSFNGVSATNNNYEIDGAAMNDYMHGSASTSYPQSENIAEFTVSSTLPDASVPRGAGGQIEATLKNGTNEFHGQGWAYLQNGAWNANSWSNNFQGVHRQPFNQQWYGGNVGGPIIIPKLYSGKNRTFFFGSYERTSTSKNSTSTLQTITNAERAGDFSASPDGVPVVNGVSTPTLLPAQMSTLGKWLNTPAGIAAWPKPTSGTETFTWNPSFDTVIQTVVARIDENFSEKHRLFGSLWWYDDSPTFQDMYDEFGEGSWATHYPNPKATWGEPVKTQVWAVNDTYTISPSMVNNFILGISTSAIEVTNTWSPTNQEFGPTETGIGGVGDVSAPPVEQVITYSRNCGMCLYNGYINPMTQYTWDIVDNFMLTKGRHTLKAGFETRNYHENFLQTYGSGATVEYEDWQTYYGGSGNWVYDMMSQATDNSAYFSQSNTAVMHVNYPAREAYVQDSYKVNPRLTVMLGARWEPQFGVSSPQNNFVTFRAGQQSTVFPTAPTGLVANEDRGIASNLYGIRWGDVGPRAGFAWDLFGNHKYALKGGYGLYSNYQVLLGYNGYSQTAPYGLSYSPPNPGISGGFTIANPYAQYNGTGAPFPYKPPFPGQPSNTTLVFPNPVNTQGLDKNYNSGQIHKFNATFEFEPANTYLVTVAWVATRGTHLDETHNINWAQFVPVAASCATGVTTCINNTNANLHAREPYFSTGFNTISMDFPDYNNMYNALQASVTKSASHGLTFLGNYTLSSNVSQNGCRYRANCQLDYYSPGITHQMSAAFRYQIPTLYAQNQISQRILGGWALGSTMSASTGSYGSVGESDCNNFDFQSAGCDANYTGGGALLKNRGRGYETTDSSGSMLGVPWLDVSKFLPADKVYVNGTTTTTTLPGVGSQLYLGSAINGVWKGPAQGIIFNGSLDKDFKIVESTRLNFHAEAFNALNHTVLYAPGYNNSVGASLVGFGAISSAAAPRNIQLSMHIIF